MKSCSSGKRTSRFAGSDPSTASTIGATRQQRDEVLMRAEIISIGTEILMGEILDTNANYMAQRLPAMGIDLYFMHQIGDNKERLVDLIQTARQRSDVVLLTGGLGPTEDDVTRDAIAESVGEEAYVVPELEAHLRNFFERRGGRMPEQKRETGDNHSVGRIDPQSARHRARLVGRKGRRDHRRDARSAGRNDRHVGERHRASTHRSLRRRSADLADAEDDRPGRVNARRAAGRPAPRPGPHRRCLSQGRRGPRTSRVEGDVRGHRP